LAHQNRVKFLYRAHQ